MLLIRSAALLARMGDPDLRVDDGRWHFGQPGPGRAGYERAQLPGAIGLDLDADRGGLIRTVISGLRAGILARLPDPTLDLGSWSDTRRARSPVATRPEPGVPP